MNHTLPRLFVMIAFFLAVTLLTAACEPAPIPAATSVPPTNIPPPLSSPTPTSLPTTTPIPSPTACSAQGTVLSNQAIPSTILAEDVLYNIYLPPCYPATAPAAGYPVLYLLHGQGADQNMWLNLDVAAITDHLIAAGEIKPLIIIMPLEKDSLLSPNQSAFPDMLLDELLPEVEKRFAACTVRDCRMLGGISRGANWAMRIGLQNSQLFSKLGGHSLTVFIGDDLATPDWIAAIPAGQMPQVWLDTGDKDRFRESFLVYENLLTTLGVPFLVQHNPGSHNMDYWAEHISDYLRWYGTDH